MKTFGFIVFIAGILLTGGSCTKENLEIEGEVLDEKTKVPIPNREIIVQALVKNDNKIIPVNIGKFSTDLSGSFQYTLKKVKNVYLYNFSVIGDSTYAYSNFELGLTELQSYRKSLSFNLNKLTDISIIIDIKGKTSHNYVLYVSWESDGTDGRYLYPYTIKNYGIMNYGIASSDLKLKWVGGDIKSEIKTRVFADKETIVRWEIYSYIQRKVFTDTILCVRDATNVVYFKY